MKTYYFGGCGKGNDWGLLSEHPFVAKRDGDEDFKGFATFEEAQAYVKSADKDEILYLSQGVWRRVHFVAT